MGKIGKEGLACLIRSPSYLLLWRLRHDLRGLIFYLQNSTRLPAQRGQMFDQCQAALESSPPADFDLY